MKYEIRNGKLIIDIESLIDTFENNIKKNSFGFVPELSEEYTNKQITDKRRLLNDENEEKYEETLSKSNTLKELISNENLLNLKSKEEIEENTQRNKKEEKDFGFVKHENNERFNTGQLLITTSTDTKQDFGQIADLDNGIYGYDRIRIYDEMGRKSDIVRLINDGPDTMYVLLNRSGVDNDTGIWTHQTEEEIEKNWKTSEDRIKESWSTNEIMIYPGEKGIFTDVYEMRVRSPTQGNKYRVTEDDIVGNTIRQVM